MGRRNGFDGREGGQFAKDVVFERETPGLIGIASGREIDVGTQGLVYVEPGADAAAVGQIAEEEEAGGEDDD